MDYNILFILTNLLICVQGETWEAPPFQENKKEVDRVQFGEYLAVTRSQILAMDENIEENVTIAYINYKGDINPVISRFLEPSSSGNTYLGAAFEKNDDSEYWQLVITKPQDYEGDGRIKFAFEISISESKYTVYLSINNIDDEPPIIEVLKNPCKIPENKAGLSDCAYNISDADGVLNNIMTYTISGSAGIEKVFEVKNEDKLTQVTKKWSALLNVMQCLDFETTSLYLIDFSVTDSAGHTSTVKIVVEVLDLPDRPPMWVNIFSSQQFEEKQAQEFQVKAVDGDINVNYEINYHLKSDRDFFSIDGTSGKISIEAIDRDKLQQEIFSFQIIAFEDPDPCSFTTQNVTIIVTDKNDNIPKITMEPMTVSIPENTFVVLDLFVQITDMDQGDNGTYRVFLEDDSANKYDRAFQIVPTQGYHSINFSISVVNSFLLDYEDLNWQNITVQITSEEVADRNHKDSKIVNIYLENLNDEYPIFAEDEYTATVLENITADEYIATVFATDRDIGDIVTHSLLGKTSNELFSINGSSGEIKTRVNNAFDYEKQKQVIIQVQAEDSLLNITHKVFAQLVVTVEDINDEQPRIKVPAKSISIKENQKNSTIVNNNDGTKITATDEDTTADLLFRIDWKESNARKNGRPVQFEDYEGCMYVDTKQIKGGGEVEAILRVNEIRANNTPDYELFDTLYLTLVVEDVNQTIGINTDKTIITINIEDVNDNAPVFNNDTINSKKNVVEHSSKGKAIASITATDADGPDYNKILFSIKPYNDTPEWIGINKNSGELYVDVEAEELDADLPIWNLIYTVTAASENLTTDAIIIISVTDINDKIPEVSKLNEIVRIYENETTGFTVQLIEATDADRDEAYNTPWYTMGSSASLEVRNFFSINMTTGQVYVDFKDNGIFDRDYGTQSFTIPVRIKDNYNAVGPGGIQLGIEASFKVLLLDYNNKAPEIKDEFRYVITSENLQKGNEIKNTIQATDDDEPGTVNTKINFTIINISKGNDANKDPPQDLFIITTDENYISGIGTFVPQYDLRGYYGTYDIEIQMNDFGEIPGPMTNTEKVYISIEKYNFEPPQFIYPSNGEAIYLSKSQDLGKALYKYDGTQLEAFKATDQQTEKWDILFGVDPDSDPSGVFTMQRVGKSQAQLYLSRQPDYDTSYKLSIIANCNCSGNEPFTTSVLIHIRFINEDSEPIFSVNAIEREIKENTTEDTITFPEATFNKEGENWNIFDIYYDLREDTSGCFQVDPNNPILSLTKELDREVQPTQTVKIVTSKNRNGKKDPDEKSILTISIKVLDINDNPPNFDQSAYYAAVKPSDDMYKVVLKVSATDFDINDTMKFTLLYDSLTTNDESIGTIKNPFYIEQESNKNFANIMLNFSVQSNMKGSFTFKIQVQDEVQHEDFASVTIQAIADSNRAVFQFANNLDDVISKKSEIEKILSSKLPYKCNVDAIQRGENANAETVTDVFLYCTDSDNNPLEASKIKETSSSIEMFSTLRTEFSRQGLYFLSLADEVVVENNEDLLLTWLIGVSVVLGTACVGLLIIFVIKTRSLTQRLNKLSTTRFGSQESGLNRLGVAAPNTNKHAIEGSNPVFGNEKKTPDMDTRSIDSGDSDLIGIEDNPNFEYNPKSNYEFSNHFRFPDRTSKS